MSDIVAGVDPDFGPPDPPEPHPSHREMAEWSCLDCGAETRAELEAPCANARCPRCGELNGLKSPGCTGHGEY